MPTSSQSHWQAVYRTLARPPLEVNHEIAAAFRHAAAGIDGPVLLLGVTPQLADIADDVTAVERHPGVIAARWPGDTVHRRAIAADWREMQFDPGSFGKCIGDGSFNSMSFADVPLLLDRIATMLRVPGRIAVRIYLTPEHCESVEAVLQAARSRRIVAFSAFKWRLAMAMVAEGGKADIAVADIFARFSDAVGDRNAFAEETGIPREEIDSIDVYANSIESYCFPTAAEVCSIIPKILRFVDFMPSGSYELAERCPIAVIDRG